MLIHVVLLVRGLEVRDWNFNRTCMRAQCRDGRVESWEALAVPSALATVHSRLRTGQSPVGAPTALQSCTFAAEPGV